MEKLNVAIADDNVRMADILGQMIEEDKDLTLVGKAHNGEEQDLVYDKQQKAVFHYTLYNRDYKYQKYLSLKGKNINDEIVSVESLDAFDLIRDYKKGYLQGELKEIASKMTEEDNAVILLMKCKK